MNALRARLQHHCNPLHVYCRLRELGVNKTLARMACACYEHLIYRIALC